MGKQKKHHRSSIHSNSDLTQQQDDNDDIFNDPPIRFVKRSVSYSGSRGSNPFSIVPDNDSDKMDSDENSDNEFELDSISQVVGKDKKLRKISSSQLTQSSLQQLSQQNQQYSQQSSQIDNQQEQQQQQQSQEQPTQQTQQKKKGKKKEKTLTMYDEKIETTQLPSKDDVNEIINHLKQASNKSYEVFLRVMQWIAVKSLAGTVLIIQIVLLIFKYIWIALYQIFYHTIYLTLYHTLKLIISLFPFLNKILLTKHDKKDPFKRSLNNANMRRITEMNLRDINTDYYDFNSKGMKKKKRFSLALDLDETLVYTEPYKQKVENNKKGNHKNNNNNIQEQEIINNNNNEIIVQVVHPTANQAQTFLLKKRPNLDIFLLEMSKLYNLIIYSSAQKQYVDAIVDTIDTNKLISNRLYREHCIKCPGVYIKDLQNAGDIAQTIILDNSTEAVKLDSANSLIIPSFRGKDNDNELQLYSKILAFVAENSIKKNISISDSLHYFKDNFL